MNSAQKKIGWIFVIIVAGLMVWFLFVTTLDRIDAIMRHNVLLFIGTVAFVGAWAVIAAGSKKKSD